MWRRLCYGEGKRSTDASAWGNSACSFSGQETSKAFRCEQEDGCLHSAYLYHSMTIHLYDGLIFPQARSNNRSGRFVSYICLAHAHIRDLVSLGSIISSMPNLFAVRTGFWRFMYCASSLW
jgi:hypothetical protein